ncbi:MAG: hypothetical protein AAB275_08225 [Deltaproteobacteria bacterium]
MEVEQEKAELVINIHHEAFYFCSERCKEEFEKEMGLIEPVKGIKIWSRFLKMLPKGTDKVLIRNLAGNRRSVIK